MDCVFFSKRLTAVIVKCASIRVHGGHPLSFSVCPVGLSWSCAPVFNVVRMSHFPDVALLWYWCLLVARRQEVFQPPARFRDVCGMDGVGIKSQPRSVRCSDLWVNVTLGLLYFCAIWPHRRPHQSPPAAVGWRPPLWLHQCQLHRCESTLSLSHTPTHTQ